MLRILKGKSMSQPQLLGEILPGAVEAIRQRCEVNADNADFPEPQNSRIGNVLAAVSDFMKAKKHDAKRRRQTWPRPKSASKQNQGTGKLC